VRATLRMEAEVWALEGASARRYTSSRTVSFIPAEKDKGAGPLIGADFSRADAVQANFEWP